MNNSIALLLIAVTNCVNGAVSFMSNFLYTCCTILSVLLLNSAPIEKSDNIKIVDRCT